MSSLELTMADYKGKELDLVIKLDSHEFLFDDYFIRTRAFFQFVWRVNMGKYEEI